ncbi:hypothetical protein [Paenibacillus sp. NPDC093718]
MFWIRTDYQVLLPGAAVGILYRSLLQSMHRGGEATGFVLDPD